MDDHEAAQELISTLNSFFDSVGYKDLMHDELALISELASLPSDRLAIFEYWLELVQRRLKLDTMLLAPSIEQLRLIAPDDYQFDATFGLEQRIDNAFVFALSPRTLRQRQQQLRRGGTFHGKNPS